VHDRAGPVTVSKTTSKGSTVKDLVWFAVIATTLVLVLVAGPILLARWMTVRRHQEQFKATGAASFPLPSTRLHERERDWQTEPTQPVTTVPAAVLDTETGELVRLNADGLPMSEADIAARTAPTTLTVDPEHLAEILQLESTAEYAINPATWAEISAAETFMRDPLTAAVMPPQPLIEEAGTPAMAATFWALVDAQAIDENGWKEGDSDFHFWTLELGEEAALVPA